MYLLHIKPLRRDRIFALYLVECLYEIEKYGNCASSNECVCECLPTYLLTVLSVRLRRGCVAALFLVSQVM